MENALIYSNVASELIEILNYLEEDVYKKIPSKVIENLSNIRNKDYNFKIDKTKTLKEQNILNETKQILSILFLKYCCTGEEAVELLKINKERSIDKEKELNEKYNIENIFENKNKNKTELLMVTEKETIYSKVAKAIKHFIEKLFGKREK